MTQHNAAKKDLAEDWAEDIKVGIADLGEYLRRFEDVSPNTVLAALIILTAWAAITAGQSEEAPQELKDYIRFYMGEEEE